MKTYYNDIVISRQVNCIITRIELPNKNVLMTRTKSQHLRNDLNPLHNRPISVIHLKDKRNKKSQLQQLQR